MKSNVSIKEIMYKYEKLSSRLYELAEAKKECFNIPFCDLTVEQKNQMAEFGSHVSKIEVLNSKEVEFEMTTGQRFIFS